MTYKEIDAHFTAYDCDLDTLGPIDQFFSGVLTVSFAKNSFTPGKRCSLGTTLLEAVRFHLSILVVMLGIISAHAADRTEKMETMGQNHTVYWVPPGFARKREIREAPVTCFSVSR